MQCNIHLHKKNSNDCLYTDDYFQYDLKSTKTLLNLTMCWLTQGDLYTHAHTPV